MNALRNSRKAIVATTTGFVLMGGAGFASAATAAAPVKLTDSQAASRLAKAGISRTSSGNCTDKRKSTCTSYSGIRTVTVNGVIDFKRDSGCSVRITGGTEEGHSRRGLHTHANGFKVDLAKSACVNNYIKKHYKYIGKRGDGYHQWRAPSGNIYCDEAKLNHWDVYYVHSMN